MKGKRGRFLGKPNSISTLKQGLVFNENTFNQYSQTPSSNKEVSMRSEEAENRLLLVDLEAKCPPGGSETVILYTTSLRGIRKTFEDCNTIRFLLGSFKVLYDERDVSMHMEFREELWKTLGGRVIPPRLFIKGRHVGGVDEVVQFHEQGKLVDLLDGIPKSPLSGPCKGCGGMRFVLCSSCNGSRKVVLEDVCAPLPVRCVNCNENGLVKCTVCF
ncbi:putative glutaredoxin, Thioredoxin-like superfamily [Helianthus annuus]|nr:putative glutaredoxin, Thioredoxin-like superfamily [Helianthus annuus]